MVSYHRCDSPEAVRAGQAKGKLLFKFEASADHPLAKVGKAALRSVLGIEIFYGHGDPSVLGEHPEGSEHDYLLSDDPLGPPPDWLIADLVERASQKVPKPRRATPAPSGNGNGATSNPAAVAKYAQAALESEVAKVAAAEEGERNNGLFAASCRVGELVGAGALDQETAAEALRQATTLPPDEAATTIRNGLSRGMECPRPVTYPPERRWCRARERGGQRSAPPRPALPRCPLPAHRWHIHPPLLAGGFCAVGGGLPIHQGPRDSRGVGSLLQGGI